MKSPQQSQRSVITMVKIISFIISLLNIFRKLLYKFECFLLQFLPNDPNPNPVSDAYRRFKVHPLPVIEPEHLPVSFDEARAAYEAKHNKPLKPVLDIKVKIILLKVLSALIAVPLMNTFLLIMVKRNLKLNVKYAKRPSLLKNPILSRLLENVLSVVKN